MNVTFVVNSWATTPIGGVGVVYHYANGLQARGHRVTVVHVALARTRPYLRDGCYRQQAAELVGGRRTVRRGAPDNVSWCHVDPAVNRRYVRTLHASDVPDGDIVVATGWQTADGVASLPIGKGRRCYLIQHHETWSGRESRVDATWRLPLRKIFIAPWLYARADAMGLLDIHRVPGAIDTVKFHVSKPISDRPRRVAMLWSHWEWKGGPDGVAALERARREVPDLEAVLFGAAPRPTDLPPWIEYRQNPPQDALVQDVYNGSSIYCCPSHAEGWHLPPAEAMASGCAVVSTDIDGVRDYAHHGENALLSPVRDANALGGNLARLLTNDGERIALAQAAHESIQQFTWARSSEELETVFERAPAAAALTTR